MLRQALKVFVSLLLLYVKPKKQNKVLLVAEYSKSGGTRTYFIYLLHFLSTKGYNITVLFNRDKEDKEIDQLVEKYGYSRLPVVFDFWCINLEQVPQGLTRSRLIRYQLNEMNFWCNLQRKHNFSSFIFSVSYPEQYLYTFLLPVHITYILHSAALQKADKYKSWLLKLCLNTHKQIIAVSVFARQSIEKYWLQNRQSKYVKHVYNYYEPKYSIAVSPSTKAVKKVLTIGSVENYKNPMLFIETAKAVIASNTEERMEFVWAGNGSMLTACREATVSFPQIQFIGNVENVEKLYADATVYYQPSLLESHGIAVLGAMYHTLPCVVSEHGGLKESIENGKSGYVISVEDIGPSVEKITVLLNTPDLCTIMGKYSYEIYVKKFTRKVWEHEMIRFL